MLLSIKSIHQLFKHEEIKSMKHKAKLFLLNSQRKYMRDYISSPDLGDNKRQACYCLTGSILRSIQFYQNIENLVLFTFLLIQLFLATGQNDRLTITQPIAEIVTTNYITDCRISFRPSKLNVLTKRAVAISSCSFLLSLIFTTPD